MRRALEQANAQVNAAFQKRDVKAYEALITTGFVRVGSNGAVFERADWLKRIVAEPGAARPAAAYDETSIRVYGDAALVTYRNKPVAPDGKPGPVGYLTRVFEKQGGQWKLAFTQSTDLQKPSPAAGPAPAALPAWSPSTAIEKEALAAFQAIQKANRDRDVAAWERLTAPDHLIITADGRKRSRSERVAELKAPPTGVTPAISERDLRLSVVGASLAIVTWRGQDQSVKVLAKSGGNWRQVLQQTSPIINARP